MVDIDFDKALFSPEHEAEEEKLIRAYFDDDNEQSDLREYIYRNGSPELVKAMKERRQFIDDMRKKGIIIN